MEPEQIGDEPLVKAEVCASAQGMPKATFYKMVKAGRIPTYKVGVKGRGLRFSITEVRQALRNGVTAG
jgi:excisionase family DNA binding protein